MENINISPNEKETYFDKYAKPYKEFFILLII